MEEKNLNEKESLELITKMIQNSKENMEVGSGNIMLLWGYVTVAVSLIVYAGLALNGSLHWHLAWTMIPVVGFPIMLISNRKKVSHVKTYTDTTINAVWFIIGTTMITAMIILWGRCNSIIMLPLALLLVSIGSAITMVVLKERILSYLCMLGVGAGLGMFGDLTGGHHLNTLNLILVFAIGFVITQIVPGYCLNHKAKKHV